MAAAAVWRGTPSTLSVTSDEAVTVTSCHDDVAKWCIFKRSLLMLSMPAASSLLIDFQLSAELSTFIRTFNRLLSAFFLLANFQPTERYLFG
jgi:hypothetical protein